MRNPECGPILRGETIGFPFSVIVRSTVHAILEQMDRFTGHDFYGSSLYGFILGLVKGNTCPGETKTPLLEERRNFQLGERDTFSPAKNLENTLILSRDLYIVESRYSVKNCRYFLNCCESVVRKRTIWTHFSKSEIFTFTVLSFLHRVANKKSNDTFLWKKLEKFDGLINKIFFVIESIMEKEFAVRFYFKFIIYIKF